MKAFADKLNVTKMILSVFDRVENLVEKGEIACTRSTRTCYVPDIKALSPYGLGQEVFLKISFFTSM